VEESLTLGSATSVATRPLAPLAVDTAAVAYRPAVFLGIGGLGGLVLSGLRRRLVERFGGDRAPAPLPLLYVDTDPRAITAAWSRGEHSGLKGSETLSMPLRDPQFYRSRHPEALHWISRRWLFNIPRSRQVEGIRPLGRLAFCDHQESLRNRIQEILQRATSEDSLRAAEEATAARFAAGPVTAYVVASLSGGTGSGAGLDVAYLLRSVLAELKRECQAIVGVLLYATSAQSSRSEIQSATALACLDELRHFSTPGLGFPGDMACRLPSFDRGPFDQTYVVDLGEGLNEADYENEAQKVAEYLFRCAASGARGFFDACRHAPQCAPTNRAGVPAIRTFAVGLADQHSPQDAGPEVRALCQFVVRAWRGGASPSLPPGEGRGEGTQDAGVATEGTSPARPAPPAFPVDAAHWSGQAAALLRGELGRKADSHFLAKWQQVRRRSADLKIAPELPLGEIDREFAIDAGRGDDGEPRPVIVTWMLDELAPLARSCNASITMKILSLVDSAEYRLEGAREVLADVGLRLDKTAAMLSALIDEMSKDLERVRRRVSAACGPEGASPGEPIFRGFTPQEAAVYQEYCRIRLCESVHRCLLGRVCDVQATVQHLAAKLADLDRRFQDMGDLLSPADASPVAGGESETSPAGSPECGERAPFSADEIGTAPCGDAASSVAFLAPAFEDRVRANSRLRPSSLLGGGSEAARRLLAAMSDEAARFLHDHLAANDAPDQSSPAASHRGGSGEAAAMPRLMNLGSGCRVLGVERDEASLAVSKQKLEATFGDCVTMQHDPGAGAFLCCEVEGIDIESIISQLARGDNRLIEMASRVHTRIDVQW
jgi:hypothetical protein